MHRQIFNNNFMKQQILNERNAFRFKRFARKAYSAFNSMHKVVNIGVIAGFMLTFAHKAETSAQTTENIKHSGMDIQELEEVTVTASRAEMLLSEAIQAVTVITRAEIEQSPVQSIQDLLKYVSGTDVRQRGTNGVQSDISLRGGTSDQIAILLNGANLSNPQTGHYSFDIPINLSDIERLEIIQGPSALIYGASAFSGGINIITKKSADTKASFKLEGGMHALYDIEASGSLQANDFTHQLSAGYTASDGYMENSDYKIFNTLWQSRLKKENSSINFQLGFNDKKYGANTFYSPKFLNQYDDTQTIFTSIRGESGDKLKVIPQIYWDRHYDTFDLVRGGSPEIPTNYHRSDVYGFNLNLQYTSPIGVTNIGGEFRNENILSNVLGNEMNKVRGKYTKSDNRNNISYFIEQNFSYQSFALSAGLLVNNNTSLEEDFHFYPSANISYKIVPSLRIYTSWGKAMRMPTFTDLYYKTSTHRGNPDLLPEESESFEIGLKFKNHMMSGHANTFYMQGTDIIDWIQRSPGAIKESMNHAVLDKIGYEVAFSVSLNEIFTILPANNKLSTSYTYLHQTKEEENDNVASRFESTYAMDYLKHKVTIQLDHSIWKGLSAYWKFRWQDREGQYEQSQLLKISDYKPYSILDLKFNWKFKSFNIFTTLNNIFNTGYVDFGSIPQAGFWFMGGINYLLN